MKFKCLKDDIFNALSIAQRGVGNNATLPILENVLIKAEGDKIYICATDLEISVSTDFNAIVTEEGRITIPIKTIMPWINLINDKEITIIVENQNMTLRTNLSKTIVKCISAEDFPSLPDFSKNTFVKIDQKDFKKSLSQVTFTTANMSSRPILSGVLIKIKDGYLTLVGTDSYRLSEKKIKIEDQNLDTSCVVPSKTLVDIEKLLGKDGEIEIIFSNSQIIFIFDNIQIISRVIDGNFPDYEKIIIKNYENEIKINRKEFIQDIKRVNIFARENNYKINLHFKNQELNITTDETEIGNEESVIKVENYDGEGSLSINSQFLLDILLVLSTDDIILKIKNRPSPVSLASDNENSFVHIIMPLKV